MKSKRFFRALLASVVVALVGYSVWQFFDRSQLRSLSDGDGTKASTVSLEQEDSDGAITLTTEMLSLSGIATEIVESGTLQLTRTLPARFAYDDTRHVALRAPTDGILQSVLVKTGDVVRVGQPVAVLRSPEIGVARSQILACETKLQLAKKTHQWQADIHEGVAILSKRIRDGDSINVIEQQMTDRTLGDFGARLMTAYSQSKFANSVSQSVSRMGDTGAVAGRVIRERESQKQVAEAALEAAIQQSLFQTQQELAKANAQVEEAQRELRLAKQTLSTLIGSVPVSSDGLDISPNDPDVSRLSICSAIEGTIERRIYSATERVSAGDELFVVADTARLWVEADIRGRDWDSISVTNGDTVMVRTEPINMPPQPAVVYYVGRQVDQVSRAIPLVATIDNSSAKFRPGQFARMIVPTERLDDVLTVSESSVIDLDGQPTVFVKRNDQYIPIAIELGKQGDGRIEILEGVAEGDVVVVAGAFTLKSELLLEGEE